MGKSGRHRTKESNESAAPSAEASPSQGLKTDAKSLGTIAAVVLFLLAGVFFLADSPTGGVVMVVVGVGAILGGRAFTAKNKSA